jgi:sugar lactone lactonase YvrE
VDPTPAERSFTIQQSSLPDKFLFAIGAQAPVGQFNFPYGVAVASDGTVYVADTVNHRIQYFGATGQFLGRWGSLGSSDGQFCSPRSVAVAPDSTVYVADTYNQRIQHFSAMGQLLGKWGSWGSGDGQLNYPQGVAVAPDGTVYVTDSNNQRIQHFSATGQFLGKWGSPGSGDGQFKDPNGVAVAPGGTVYVADGNHHIQYFSATGQFLGKWGSPGSGDGQFNGPEGVAVAPDGTVYAVDRENHRIQHFSATGQFLGKWGSYGGGDGQFSYPRRVAVAPGGTVYVADSNHRIQYFSATGQFLGKWGSWGSSDGQLSGPESVAAAFDDTIYVADSNNYRIQRFSATGQFLGKWGSYGGGDGQFGWPHGVAVAPDDTVYVTDDGNQRIQRFGATGQFLGKWGSPGSGDGQFNSPQGVAVASDGTVYVADTVNHRIQHFSATGQFLGKWGSQGSDDGQFIYPRGVAVAPGGTVYVADSGNHRIQYFSATGQLLGKWGYPGSGDGQLSGPWGVAVAADGTVYVADWNNHRIQRFSATGQFLGKWGSYGSGDGQFDWPSGVAMAPDGTVYVAETGSNFRIQAFGTTYPTTWRGEYFANRWLAERPVLIRQDAAIDFNWGGGSPGTGVPADNFSARWQRYVSFDAGTYRFTVFTDDGVRLWVDDKLLIEAWQYPQVATFSADISLTQGYHQVRLEYYEAGGSAAVRLSWALATQTYTISGRVTDDTSAAVSGATVSATGPANASTTTASDGTYTLSNLPVGTYSVSASKTGYTSPAARSATVPPNATNVDFVLQRQAQNVGVAISPSSKAATVGAIFTLDIRISAGSQPVDSVDSYLSFDRNYLRVVDASGNETNSIIPGATLPVVLQNSADNSQGRIAYSAGKQLGGVSPSGDFVLATIRFKAIAAIGGGGTNVNFLSGTGVFYQGNSLPIFTSNGNVQIQEAISLKGRVTLQGRGNPPDSRWNNFPLALTLYAPGGASPVGNYTANTDTSGYFTVTGITQGTYDAKVKNAHTLSIKKNNVAVPTGSTAVDFGTMLEGDANNDDNIGGGDYSILATAYGKCSGQSGWDSRADFNGSGCIEGADYSLLANNYGRHGPIILTITRVGPVETEVTTGSVVISVDPSSRSVTPGAVFTLDIKIAAGSQAVDSVDSYLSFDRNYLRVVDVSGNETNDIMAGAALPVVLQNSADNSQGRIAYSAGKQLGGVSPSGDFVLATIRFKAIAATPGGSIAIAFQSGTDAFYQGDSVLGTLANGAVSAGYRVYLPILLRQYNSW